MVTVNLVKKEEIKKPNFKFGDNVKVYFKVKEGENERIQVFEGVVIRLKGRDASKTFTVRKVSFGVGVERIFPLYSPLIEKIDVVKTGKVRRAKLYYLRKLSGKSARIQETKEIPDKNEENNTSAITTEKGAT